MDICKKVETRNRRTKSQTITCKSLSFKYRENHKKDLSSSYNETSSFEKSLSFFRMLEKDSDKNKQTLELNNNTRRICKEYVPYRINLTSIIRNLNQELKKKTISSENNQCYVLKREFNFKTLLAIFNK